MFQPVSNKTDFPQMERDMLAFWDAHGTFKKSLEKNEGKRDYVFYDGPPFATGLPHYGHLLAGTIKDIVPRYQTMRGCHVERRFGWDCHGLPIEALAQEALNVSGAYEIRQLGVGAFNEQCRSMVLKYVDEWRKTVTRMGRWVDFDNDYKTMDPDFMESIWWVFKQLWEQGRVYKSYRIMPYSWKLSTPLSNFEAGSNYKDVQDPAVTVRVRVKNLDSARFGSTRIDSTRLWLLIWTTTPWTLPENLAICAGADIDYVVVRDAKDDACYVMAEERLAAYYKKAEDYTLVAKLKGADLLGWTYEPMFPHFADSKDCFRVLNDPFVTTADGTGLVHLAPAYGEDDFRVCRENGISIIVDPLDASCNFTDQLPEYAGRFCKDCDKDLIRWLKQEGKLVHQTTLVHSYPFCDRTDTPLIYRAIEAWYVRVEDLHDRLTKNNDSVRWMPPYVGDKRFGNWLKEARDWNISRNRFWGSCIPVWVNEDDASDMICVGSVAELEALSGVRVTDLHKHFVDEIVIRKDGKTYRRTPEVLDCWFESGAMPYAQVHYPFGESSKVLNCESSKVPSETAAQRAAEEQRNFRTLELQNFRTSSDFSTFFPADFIAEGLDQTRGWFYTLMVLGTCLFDQSPFRNVVVNGLVLAEDGKKMSKRLKNYPDPTHILDVYGADALRLYMIYSPVVRAENLRFSENGVKQILRDLLIPWWNAYSFFVTYANVDGFNEEEVGVKESRGQGVQGSRGQGVKDSLTVETLPPPLTPEPLNPLTPEPLNPLTPVSGSSPNVLDRWIVSSLETLVGEVTDAMDGYDLQRSVRPFVNFVEDLTNWYIRRSRRRFWKSQNDDDKLHAYRTLRYVLVQLSKVAAPFTPFISEAIYRNLKGASDPESVHLCDFPTANANARDEALEKRMALVQTVVKMGRQLRTENDLKVRQPLGKLHIVSANADIVSTFASDEDLIRDELNVKEIAYGSDETALAEVTLKADFKALGPKCGANMPTVAKAISQFTTAQIQTLIAGGTIAVGAVEVSLNEVILQRKPKAGMVVAAEGEIIVALDTALTPALVQEGLAREFVSRVQNLRKEADFEVTQRIAITVASDDEITAALGQFADYIKAETLCDNLVFTDTLTVEPCDLNGHETRISVVRLLKEGGF